MVWGNQKKCQPQRILVFPLPKTPHLTCTNLNIIQPFSLFPTFKMILFLISSHIRVSRWHKLGSWRVLHRIPVVTCKDSFYWQKSTLCHEYRAKKSKLRKRCKSKSWQTVHAWWTHSCDLTRWTLLPVHHTVHVSSKTEKRTNFSPPGLHPTSGHPHKHIHSHTHTRTYLYRHILYRPYIIPRILKVYFTIRWLKPPFLLCYKIILTLSYTW